VGRDAASKSQALEAADSLFWQFGWDQVVASIAPAIIKSLAFERCAN